jgi:hypothetical protein
VAQAQIEAEGFIISRNGAMTFGKMTLGRRAFGRMTRK